MTALTSDQIAQFTSPVTIDGAAKQDHRSRSLFIASILFVTDCIAAIISVCATQVMTHATSRPSAVLVVVIAYLGWKGRYTARLPTSDALRLLLSGAGLCLSLAVFEAVSTGDVSASVVAGLATLLFCVTAIIGNLLARQVLGKLNVWQIPVAIIGSGRTAIEAEAALRSDRSLGYDVVGRIAPGAIDLCAGRPALGPLMAQLDAVRLLVAVDDDLELRQRLIDIARSERIGFSVLSTAGADLSFRARPTRFFGRDITMHCVDDGLARRAARRGKTLCDLAGAASLLVACSPAFLILVVLTRLDGGPAFFRQSRIGIGGRPFRCLKFRTMVVDAEARLAKLLAEDPALAVEWDATRKLKDDPRITRVGRFLRKTSLDELPQFINVLRGEMSLIGPRPIAESEMPLYGVDINHYLGAKPGLTGIWQVSGRSNTSYERRVQLDAWYVRNWTLWNDLAILARTIPAVLRRDGAQ